MMFYRQYNPTLRSLLIKFFLLYSVVLNSQEFAEGYKEIKLGMNIETVRGLISSMNDFLPIRDEILQIRIEPDKQILTTQGLNFVNKGYFHFHDDSLYQILIKFNSTKIGYYNLLKNLTEKYGKPIALTPKKASWENEKIRITIEKPSTIKYTDKLIWESIIGNNNTNDPNFIILRDEFLDNL